MCASSGDLAASAQSLSAETCKGKNWEGTGLIFSVLAVFDPDFPLCDIFAKMLICLYEYTLRNLFANFAVSIYIFPVCPISLFSKVLVSPHFNDSLIATLSPNSPTNPISKAIATFITQPTKFGGGILYLIHSGSVYPFVVYCTMSEQKKIEIALYVEYEI